MAYYRVDSELPPTPEDQTACRMCLEIDPASDLIKPCSCSGSVALVHRECLDRWRTLSPHPEALSRCELCKTPYKMLYKDDESDCWRKTRYVAAVTLDISVFVAICFGLYLLSGYLGNLALNQLAMDIFCKKTYIGANVTLDCTPAFLNAVIPMWNGRIWFYGFCVFFFILGIFGCCFACCYRDEGNPTDYGHNRYDRGDCWWLFCGPSYYNGYYYYSPYGYWGPGDMFCWWCFWDTHFHGHHYHGCNMMACTGCCAGDCSGVGHNCSGGDSNGNGALVLLIVVLVIIAIFIIIGVIFGTILASMVLGKIVKRHLMMLDRRANARTFLVADLNNPAQVAEADRQAAAGIEAFERIRIPEDPEAPLSIQQQPKGKYTDY